MVAACAGSMMSLGARPTVVCMRACVCVCIICLLIQVGGNNETKSISTEASDGETLCRLYTLSVTLNFHTNIIHALQAIDLEQGVVCVLRNNTL